MSGTYIIPKSSDGGIDQDIPHFLRMCRHCGADLPNLAQVMAHCLHCVQNINLECPVCHVPFKRKDNLRTHMRNKHNLGEKPICTKCGAVFRSFIRLNFHVKQCTT